MAISQKLKELRLSRGYTQAEVARGINCSPNTYSRYESGAREPSHDTLKLLAEFYGVSMDYLYGLAPLSESALSDYELTLINGVRNTDDEVKEDLLDLLIFKTNKKKKSDTL